MSEFPRRVEVESDLSQPPIETDRLRALRWQTQAPSTGEIEQAQIAAPGPRATLEISRQDAGCASCDDVADTVANLETSP